MSPRIPGASARPADVAPTLMPSGRVGSTRPVGPQRDGRRSRRQRTLPRSSASRSSCPSRTISSAGGTGRSPPLAQHLLVRLRERLAPAGSSRTSVALTSVVRERQEPRSRFAVVLQRDRDRLGDRPSRQFLDPGSCLGRLDHCARGAPALSRGFTRTETAPHLWRGAATSGERRSRFIAPSPAPPPARRRPSGRRGRPTARRSG